MAGRSVAWPDIACADPVNGAGDRVNGHPEPPGGDHSLADPGRSPG